MVRGIQLKLEMIFTEILKKKIKCLQIQGRQIESFFFQDIFLKY